MKKVTVYGPGCAKCKQTAELVKKVIAETGADVEFEKVEDLRSIIAAGVMSSPAVAIDGEIKVTGRVPKANEVKAWLGAPSGG